MANNVNVDFVTKVVEIQVDDNKPESLAALAAINAAQRADEAADLVVNNVADTMAAIDSKAAEKEDELDAYAQTKEEELDLQVQPYIDEANTILQAVRNEYGYPFVAATAAAMTDTSKIYVYTGSETGYTAGNWYYHNGTAFVSGGVYNSVAFQVDPTLSVEDEAADAKAAGDAVKGTKSEMSLFGVDDLLWDGEWTGYTVAGSGLTYTVDKLSRKITVSGTATGTSFCRFYYSLSVLPSWLVKGKTYIMHINTDTDMKMSIGYYKNNQSGAVEIWETQSSRAFVIPNDATGMIIRVFTGAGNTVNGVVRPYISEAPSLSELGAEVKKIPQNFEAISMSTDFDGLVNYGYYLISSNSQVTPSASNPLPNNVVGLLCVFPTVNNGVTQIVFSEKSLNYVRRYSPSQSTWTDWAPFFSDADCMKKFGGIAIPYNTDFDDLTETGFSFVNAGAKSTTGYINCPSTNGGVLQIYNTGTIITQVFEGAKTSEHYSRRRYQNEWSDWVGSENRKSLKVLSIGNSGHQDMLTYVPFIMQNVAPELDLTLGITYVSGATIDRQIELFDTDEAVISFDLCRPRASSWTIKANQTMKQCLLAEDWDVIMVGQASTYQMDFANYSGIPELLDKVATYVGTDHDDYKGHPVKFGYLGPQVRLANNNMVIIVTPDSYPDYMDAVQQALDAYPLEFAIMGGTAVENARGTSLAQYGDAVIYTDSTHTEVAITGQMNYDYAHMQEGIGCMVGSYCSVLGLLELAGIYNRSIFGEGTRPDLAWLTSRNIPGKNPASPQSESDVVGISDENCRIAQKCAVMAHKKPFEVSTIV